MNHTLDARRCAGLSGLAAAVLFGVGSAIWGLDMPEGGAPASELLDFYRDDADRIVVGATLSLLAIAVFVLFAAAFRRVLAEAEGDDLLATTAFGGAVLGCAAGLGAESINMMGAIRAQDGELSPELARSLFEVPQVLGTYGGGLGFGVLALATAAVVLRTGLVLPRWVALVTLVVGVVLLSPVARIQEVTGTSVVVLGLLIGVPLLRAPGPSRSAR